MGTEGLSRNALLRCALVTTQCTAEEGGREEEEEECDGDDYDHHGQATPRSGQRLPLGSKIVPTMMALMASQTLAYDAVDPQF